MTGIFTTAPRNFECITLDCRTVIRAGEPVYLFKKLERQPVCLPCAKRRWGYSPEDAPAASTPQTERASIGFDSTRSILKQLQARANANDPKSRAAGER